MTFDNFYEIIATKGIQEFLFRIPNQNKYCCLGMKIVDYKIVYWISLSEYENFEYSLLDEMLNHPLSGNLTIKDLWEDIEILLIDGYDEQDCTPDKGSFNYYQYLEDLGTIQWKQKLSPWQTLAYALKYIIIGPCFFFIIGVIMAIVDRGNWKILLFFGGLVILTLIVAIPIVLYKNKNLRFIITDKHIIKEMGLLVLHTKYSEIDKINLKRSLFHKDKGHIKIYLKKGLSINHHLDHINNVHEVYKIINRNMNREK